MAHDEAPNRTVRDALRLARERLGERRDVRTDAEELVSRAIGAGRGDLRTAPGRVITAEEWRRLEAWIERRRGGEPVQYVTGRAAFRDLDLEVGPGVLVPRPETEQLVEAVLQVLRAESAAWPAPRVLDLGTGSGAIALAIAAEHPAARVIATDRSAAALAMAEANARRLGLLGRVELRSGAWLDAVDADERFEAIVSNPPYVAEAEWDELEDDVRLHEPPDALFSGTEGLDATRAIVEDAPRHLVTGGLLALELADARAAEVAGWLEGAHDFEGVTLRDDLSGRPRILLARRARGPRIAPAQWPEAG